MTPFPTNDQLLAHALAHKPARDYATDNLFRFKRMHGGLAMARQHRIRFDPRADYWRRPERRLAVAYLALRWNGRCTPTALVREHALLVCQHLERLRTERGFKAFGADYPKIGGWEPIGQQLMQHATEMQYWEHWLKLATIWNLHPDPGTDLAAYVETTLAKTDGPRSDEDTFQRRAGWFGYLGALNLDDAKERQRFFFGYVSLLTSTNAYMHGGASQTFASVIQNTDTGAILDLIATWQDKMLSPAQTGFSTLGSSDETAVDRSHYSIVKELFGFLCLTRVPFVNGATQAKYCAEYGTSDVYEAIHRAGHANRQWLEADPARVAGFAAQFDTLWADARIGDRFAHFETVDRGKDFVRAGDTSESLVNTALRTELEAHAESGREKLTPVEKAMCALHLLADGWLCNPPREQAPPQPPEPDESTGEQATDLDVAKLRLPPGLRETGERALAFLRTGAHVLLAGAPGTGKTTLAQFVADAWNHERPSLEAELRLDELPTTVVAHSGWSPFHTVGGMMQDETGKWGHEPGIFVEAAHDGWQLRNEALVLDEMNRADLDRSVGDLYPLLSQSVARVRPAGIPGIGSLRLSARFRLVATVNDTNLDDIVYPISEGLARRFVRIELAGVSEDDARDFVLNDAPDSARKVAASELLAALFKQASQIEGDVRRLPVGAGYLRLLRDWVHGALVYPASAAGSAEAAVAMELLHAGFASALKQQRKLREVLDAMRRADGE